MRKTFLIVCCLFFIVRLTSAQSIGVGTIAPNSSAILDITHTGKGLLIPRMSTAAVNNISAPAKGLMVYDSVAAQLMINIGTPAVRNWQNVSSKTSWGLAGNSGINPVNQFIGNTDNQPLRFRINNIQAGELHPSTGNVFWGLRAGETNTTGYSNIAIGTDALKRNSIRSNLVAIGDSALFNNGTGASSPAEAIFNTAVGSKSLFSNTTGGLNTAIGSYSLYNNNTGNRNTAIGVSSLYTNTAGYYNTATGFESLLFNSTGFNNTAMGFQCLFSNNGVANTAVGATAMFSNISGSNNTATGYQALKANIEGNNNTATGYQALNANTIGSFNTAAGFQSLVLNTTGGSNTALGSKSLYTNSSGSLNTAVGSEALSQNMAGSENTAIGDRAMLSNKGYYNTAVGSQALLNTINSQYNTAIGYHAATEVDLGYNNTIIGANANVHYSGLFNCVALGESARCYASNTVRFGNNATNSIGGIVGFTSLSDGRYKKNVQEKVKGIDFIMKLRPVIYQMDIDGLNSKSNPGGKTKKLPAKEVNENGKTLFSGFIAQEVEQAAKDADYDFSGVDKPKNENDFYGLRYSEFVVPIVKAIQEQQKLIEKQQQQMDEMKKDNEEMKRVIASQEIQLIELLKKAIKLEPDLTQKK